jgi:hypothetical protein
LREKLRKIIKLALCFWAVFALFIFFYTDFTQAHSLANSDYLTTFYTAGWIADHEQWQLLYPVKDAATFHHAPFDLKAHELLPLMPDYSVAEYMYMPLSSLVFAPYSKLLPQWSLFAWQITSILAILGSAYFVIRPNVEKNKPVLASCIMAATGSLAFLPTSNTLWIGQVGLVFGLAPLSLSYFFLAKNQPVKAGFTAALLFLKPQMLIPAFFLMASELSRKRLTMVIGFLAGLMLLGQANYLVGGNSLMEAWINCLRTSDKVFSDPSHGVAIALATSLPRAILLSQPASEHGLLKPIVYGLALLLGLAGMSLSLRAHKRQLEPLAACNLAFALGLLALPVVVPHLFLYDTSILMPLGFLLFAVPGRAALGLSIEALIKIQKLVSLYWLIVCAYWLILITNGKLANPLLLVFSFLAFYLAILFLAYKNLETSSSISATSSSSFLATPGIEPSAEESAEN